MEKRGRIFRIERSLLIPYVPELRSLALDLYLSHLFLPRFQPLNRLSSRLASLLLLAE